MEIREAMSRLKDHFRVHDDGRPTPKLDEACRIAYECMEKQLPKKAEFLYMVDDKRARFRCECGNVFDHECPTFPYKDMDFCDKCGQRLDWTGQGESNGKI